MSTKKTVVSEEALDQAKAWLKGVEVGEGVHHRNVTVFPLFKEEKPGKSVTGTSQPPAHPSQSPIVPERYVLLADAIEAGEAVVEEIDEGGQVPFLGVENSSVKPILIPEGEILIGAKQNRTVNITVLVAAGIKFKLPVSCVEQGRWRYDSRRFEAASYAHPKLREKKLRSALLNREMVGEARSDQGEVWEEVDEHLYAIAAPSPTANVVDASRAASGRIEEYREAIELPEGACGFVAARGREVVGLDLFDSPVTMKKLWKRLGDAYFLGALSEGEDAPAATKGLAEGFLESVAESLSPAPKQPQLGIELEITSDDLSGTALWHEGAVCHLAAFPS